jgi:hypothetical protein
MTINVGSQRKWNQSETESLIDAINEVEKMNKKLSLIGKLEEIKKKFGNPYERTDIAIRNKILKIYTKQTAPTAKFRRWTPVEDTIVRNAINLAFEIKKTKNIIIDKNEICKHIQALLPNRKMESIKDKYYKFIREQSKYSNVALQPFELLAIVGKNEYDKTPISKNPFDNFSESNLTATASEVISEHSSESLPQLPLENPSSEDDNYTRDPSQDSFKAKKSPQKKQKTKSNVTNNSFSLSDVKTITLFSKLMINPKNPTESEIQTLQTFLMEYHTPEEIKDFLNQGL